MKPRYQHPIADQLAEAMMYLESMYSDCPVPDEKLMICAHALIQKVKREYVDQKDFEIDKDTAEILADVRAVYAIADVMEKK